MATLRPNNIVHISQASRRTAYRHDAYDFITGLTDAGFAVLIMWVDGADTEYRLRCNREFYPTPPTLKELVDFSPEEQQRVRDAESFEKTGQSPCLWQPEQALTG